MKNTLHFKCCCNSDSVPYQKRQEGSNGVCIKTNHWSLLTVPLEGCSWFIPSHCPKLNCDDFLVTCYTTYILSDRGVQSFWLLWMMCRLSQLTKHTQYYIQLLSNAQNFLQMKEVLKCVCSKTYQWPGWAPCSTWSTYASCTPFSTTTDISNRSMAHKFYYVPELTGNSCLYVYFLSWSAYFVLVVSVRKT